MRASKITITRFDPVTGEMLGEPVKVPANHFKPKRPKLPKLDEGRLTAPRSGWSVLYMHDHLEREIAFWEAHRDCLTRSECSSIAHGSAAVIRPIKPSWRVGDVLEAASRVWAEVETVKWTSRGYRTTFKVRDDRPTLVRRTPKMFEPPDLDHLGHPVPHTKEAIAAARIDGNYTQDASQAVSTAGEGVGIEYQNGLVVKMRAKAAEREAPEEVRRKRERAIRDELRATMKGLGPQAQAALLANIEREIQKARMKTAA